MSTRQPSTKNIHAQLNFYMSSLWQSCRVKLLFFLLIEFLRTFKLPAHFILENWGITKKYFQDSKLSIHWICKVHRYRCTLWKCFMWTAISQVFHVGMVWCQSTPWKSRAVLKYSNIYLGLENDISKILYSWNYG